MGQAERADAAHRVAGLAEVNESELWVRIKHNGAVIRVYGADNPDAMRGVRLDGVVMDEVAQMDPTVWDDVVQPALSDRLGWALFIGTPNGINLFSQLYFGAGGKEDWFAARYTVYDTDALDPHEVARLRRDLEAVFLELTAGTDAGYPAQGLGPSPDRSPRHRLCPGLVCPGCGPGGQCPGRRAAGGGLWPVQQYPQPSDQ